MPGMNGLELIRRVRAEWPRLPMLVLSMHAEEEYALRAFQSGANGYITKDSPTQELIAAVCKVLHGGTHVTPDIAERVMQRLNGSVEVPDHARLSNRELEVLRRLVAGERPTDIAEAMHLSIKTISTHKSRIMERLHVTSMAGLVRYGLQHGLGVESEPPGEPQFITTSPGKLN
jgi:DNA-binding NarL/FixJ family response regulator